MSAIRFTPAFALITAALALTAPLQAQCYINYGLADSAKPNKLFLYFPTASDSTFPEINDDFGNPVGATPALPFNASDLDSSLGTTAQFRDAIYDIVKSDYCEFNVQVLQTTTNPDSAATPAARRIVVAVGSDSNPDLYGIASSVDIGDNDVTEHARVWANTYGDIAAPGGELSGANATRQRWANGIGGTASHEAGHTYGLTHGDDVTPRSGEDSDTRHILRAGVSVGTRVGGRRHFSDTGFGILAANVGLAVQTVHNWDFTNPNSVDARELRMEILSTQALLTLGWSYNGPRTPWINPVISNLSGTVTFKGTTYNRFQVRWSSGQAWSNTEVAPFEPSGIVGPAKNFHIGATFVGVDFDTPDPVIVRDVTLHDASGTALPLHPRMVAYDAGALDSIDGTFDVRVFNMDPTRPLLIRDVRVFELPRVLSINSMLAGKPMFTWDDLPVVPYRSKELPNVAIRDEQVLAVASLKQGHTIFIDHDRQRPNNPVIGAADAPNPAREVNEIAHGIATGLFPSTIVYITMTVVDPDAEHWDPAQARMVRGPVESKLFYQLRGVRPDLNHNGDDDLVEIYQGAPDTNGNGVIDTVEGGPAPSGPKKVRFYPFIGWTRFDNSVPLEDGPVIGLRASSLGSVFALEGEAGFTVTEDVSGNEGTMIQAGLNLRRFFGGPGATVRPFLLAGAGGLLFRGFTRDDDAVALHLGGGIEKTLGTSTLRLDVRDILSRDIYSSGTTNNWQVTLALGF